ncbi:hypothetical protein CVT24_005581 [Panaeolus cyanescens]|uniref:AB hydrolase-1 domain-containing protein n=1 Tax=Panaeolus cyanescens TaxID=181874 RepID=A0A409VQQ7_9AGAR|nr:hypothetical protein CVT24_005581 [Panaeolus cyanescens]
MPETTLTTEKYYLPTHTNGVRLICAYNKYTRGGGEGKGKGRIILVLGHGGGFSKEHYEPFLHDIFALEASYCQREPDSRSLKGPKYLIREAWALDAPNHGESGVMNEHELVRNPGVADIWDNASAFTTLLSSGLFGPLDKGYHQVIVCGHSAGSVAAVLSTQYFNPPASLPFNSLILIDPAMWSRSLGEKGFKSPMYQAYANSVLTRRDVWRSKEEAREWMRKREPGRGWDERVFDTFIEHGLRPLPTAHYPHLTSGVTLTTHRSDENMAFSGRLYSLDAADRLSQICRFRRVHLVYGGKADMFSREVQDSLNSPNEGRIFASITRLSKRVGHLASLFLVVQEAPLELAQAMFDILLKEVEFGDDLGAGIPVVGTNAGHATKEAPSSKL